MIPSTDAFISPDMAKKNKKKNTLTGKIINYALIAFILVILLVPNAKVYVHRGLMSIGLFKPGTELPKNSERKTTANIEMQLISDIDGALLNIKSFEGQVVFINFWATWCPPCIAEMPTIEKLYHKFKNNRKVSFVLVDVDGDQEKSRKFMQKKNLNLPIYYPASPLPDTFYSGTLPTTIILDKRGNIVTQWHGLRNYGGEDMVEFLNALAKE